MSTMTAPDAPRPGANAQAGVSLIEAIVGLVVSGMLISSMGAMLVNMQGVYQRVQGSFAADRDDVFTERQLHALMRRVVNQPGKRANTERFEGGRDEIRGVTIGGLMGHELATPFVMKVLSDDDDGAILSVELDEIEYKLSMRRLTSARFSFLDARGRVHDTWPPSNQNTSLISGTTGRFARSALPAAVIVESEDSFGDAPGRTLVLRLSGARIYPDNKK